VKKGVSLANHTGSALSRSLLHLRREQCRRQPVAGAAVRPCDTVSRASSTGATLIPIMDIPTEADTNIEGIPILEQRGLSGTGYLR
jgi:hypothetical protein